MCISHYCYLKTHKLFLHKGMSASEVLCSEEVHSDHFMGLCLTKLEQQQFHLIRWSRIIMVAETSFWESIFLYFFPYFFILCTFWKCKECILACICTQHHTLSWFFSLCWLIWKYVLSYKALSKRRSSSIKIDRAPFSKITLQRSLQIFNYF